MPLTEAQLALKDEKHISASQAAKVLFDPVGEFTYRTGRKARPPIEGEELEWGNRAETMIAQKVEESLPISLAVFNPATSYIHPDLDWLVATPDRTIETRAADPFPSSLGGVMQAPRPAPDVQLVEIKNVNAFMASLWGKEGNWEDVPAAFQVQGRIQQAVLDTEQPLMFAPLMGGNHFCPCEMPRDREREEAIIGRLDEFLHHYVAKDIAPPVTPATHMDTMRALSPLHAEGKVLEADDYASVLVGALRNAIRAAKREEAVVEWRKVQIADIMGNAEALTSEWGKVTFKATKDSTRTSWKDVVQSLEKAELSPEMRDLLQVFMAHHSEAVKGTRKFSTPRGWLKDLDEEEEGHGVPHTSD